VGEGDKKLQTLKNIIIILNTVFILVIVANARTKILPITIFENVSNAVKSLVKVMALLISRTGPHSILLFHLFKKKKLICLIYVAFQVQGFQ